MESTCGPYMPGAVENELANDPALRLSARRYAALTSAYFAPSAAVPLLTVGQCNLDPGF